MSRAFSHKINSKMCWCTDHSHVYVIYRNVSDNYITFYISYCSMHVFNVYIRNCFKNILASHMNVVGYICLLNMGMTSFSILCTVCYK